MKLLWMSNAPFTKTGYGAQTARFVPKLAGLGHQMGIFAFYGLEGGQLAWGNIPIYPKLYDPWGMDVVRGHAFHFRSDAVITLMDAWVVDLQVMDGLNWVPYYPVDHDPIPEPIAQKVRNSILPIAYSQFGQAVSQEAGIQARYVPHAFDPAIHKRMDKREARQMLGWPQDRFIAGMVAANKGYPSRKAFPQSLRAFAKFRQKRSDALLYLHTTTGEHGELGGINLKKEAQQLGIAPAILFPDQYLYQAGHLSDEYLALVYNAMDVLLAASMGEGFGVPILEAQACGTPVITGDWTSMSELTFLGRDWMLDREDSTPFPTPLGTDQFLPHIDPMVERLLFAYDILAGGDIDALRADLVLASQPYAIEYVVAKYWKPVLEELETLLGQTGNPADRYAFYQRNPSDIKEHLPELRERAHGTVLELGVREAVSTAALLTGVAEHGGHLYSVDVMPECGRYYAGHPNWTFIHADSRDKAAIQSAGVPDVLDVLFIDTEHTYEQVLSELNTWGDMVKPGGVILAHDTDSFPGVAQAIMAWAMERGYQPEFRHESNGLGVIAIPEGVIDAQENRRHPAGLQHA